MMLPNVESLLGGILDEVADLLFEFHAFLSQSQSMCSSIASTPQVISEKVFSKSVLDKFASWTLH